MLVNKSIKLGLRTKDDWEKQLSWMRLADSENSLNWAMSTDEKPIEKKKPGRSSGEMTFVELYRYCTPTGKRETSAYCLLRTSQ